MGPQCARDSSDHGRLKFEGRTFVLYPRGFWHYMARKPRYHTGTTRGGVRRVCGLPRLTTLCEMLTPHPQPLKPNLTSLCFGCHLNIIVRHSSEVSPVDMKWRAGTTP